jgi:hypothetical protein
MRDRYTTLVAATATAGCAAVVCPEATTVVGMKPLAVLAW